MSATSPLLKRPKINALDSSHLGKIAADSAAKDHARRQRARTFEEAMASTGSVLLLSWHHLEELFSHHRAEVIAERMAYVQPLSMVAAVSSFRNQRYGNFKRLNIDDRADRAFAAQLVAAFARLLD